MKAGFPPYQSPTTHDNSPALNSSHDSPLCSGLPCGLITDPAQIVTRIGIVEAHLEPLSQLAERTNTIIAIRAVDPSSTQLIAAGQPTKGFHIKGKSASWGPMAGHIPVNQHLSKLAGSEVGRIDKFNDQIQQCIAAGHAIAVPLSISTERLDALLKQGALSIGHNHDKHLSLYSTSPSGRKYQFEAVQQEDDCYQISCDGQALMVLAHPLFKEPFTADYDLLLLAPSLTDYGKQDKLPLPDVTHHAFQQRLTQNERFHATLKQDYETPASYYAKEDPDIGNASIRVKEMITQINEVLGCSAGREVVHHSIDATSPASDPDANYPATFFLPRSFGSLGRVVVVEDHAAFTWLIKTIQEAGYQVPTNPLWHETLGDLRRPSFINTLAQWQQRST